mmetsp:Transcript_29491/g.73742  ORF Transcript_29491/g.73742 Transcript_29491/m.73742 type:complete len:609 (+) Transcript_29491:1498-3324(+)
MHVGLQIRDALEIIHVQEDAYAWHEPLELALNGGHRILCSAPYMRVEKMEPLALIEHKLRLLVRAPDADQVISAILSDDVRKGADQEDDHGYREAEEQVDDVVRRAEPKQARGDARQNKLSLQLQVIVQSDIAPAHEGHEQHQLAAHGESLILGAAVRCGVESEDERREANQNGDGDARERVALVDEQQPAGQAGAAHELDHLPVEALRPVVAVQEGDGVHEAGRHALEDGLARGVEQSRAEHDGANRPDGDEEVAEVRQLLVLVALVALHREVRSQVVDVIVVRGWERLARPRLEDDGAQRRQADEDDEQRDCRRGHGGVPEDRGDATMLMFAPARESHSEHEPQEDARDEAEGEKRSDHQADREASGEALFREEEREVEAERLQLLEESGKRVGELDGTNRLHGHDDLVEGYRDLQFGLQAESLQLAHQVALRHATYRAVQRRGARGRADAIRGDGAADDAVGTRQDRRERRAHEEHLPHRVRRRAVARVAARVLLVEVALPVAQLAPRAVVPVGAVAVALVAESAAAEARRPVAAPTARLREERVAGDAPVAFLHHHARRRHVGGAADAAEAIAPRAVGRRRVGGGPVEPRRAEGAVLAAAVGGE